MLFVYCYNQSITKLNWLKQKKVILIALAVFFLCALFFTKNTDIFKNLTGRGGLVYSGNETVEDLVARDTDLDGVSDWEEGLFGTDPTKKDTNDDGIPDNIEIAKRRGQSLENGEFNLSLDGTDGGNLSRTEMFSRELFSTVAALNQAGVIDQDTIDKLSDSLVGQIQNSSSKKTFSYSDLKIIKLDNLQTIRNYNNALNNIYDRYPTKNATIDVLYEIVIDENTFDESALAELDPIIKQTNNIINEMAKMNVPESLALSHLGLLNELQRFSENLSNIRIYDVDPVLAVGSISKYEASVANLESAASNLTKAINQRLAL